MNFTELLSIVSNSDTGISFLQQHNIVKVSEVCENGHIMFIKGSRWRCQKRSCRKEKGLRINNWLTGSRLPIHTIVHFIYYWAREMSSVTFCKRELNMGQNAVVDWSNYLREVCVTEIFLNHIWQSLCGEHVSENKTHLKLSSKIFLNSGLHYN
ncbi:unnamed protein product [Macrosiphum euphorbiae]|uniref:Transposase n=1 Tax=Macrosiphum euphorbiae TaxID=13131 RepID=A0AAV0XBU6_9HEMI|nr:unnamed protein product [Macrosiphum euphorbiae]